MLRLRIATGLLLSLVIPTALQAQGLGGLIKRKAAEAVKPKNEPAQKANEPDNPDSRLPYDLTPETMVAFKRGLELEIKLREDYRKELAQFKTAAQYEACTTKAASSPEAAKVLEEYLVRMEKVKTPEEVQKLAEWQNGAIDAMHLKLCGRDPKPLIARQTERFTKAQYDGAMEFAKAFRKPPSHDNPMGNREQDSDCLENELEDGSSIGSFGCGAEFGVQEAPNATTDAKVLEYLKLKELVEKYCSLSPAMRADAEKNGIRVPGTGNNIYWVFSRGFAIWVGPDCEHLMKLFSIVTSK